MAEYIKGGFTPQRACGVIKVYRYSEDAHPPGRLLIAGLLLLACLLLAATPPPPATPVKITRTTRSDPAKNLSAWPSFSGDGNTLAFSSLDTLTPEDTNAFSDIYIYDHSTGNLKIASLTSEGAPANGASYRPVLSASSRYIAFTSLATNLDANDTNGLPDIYFRDLATGKTLRLSSPLDGSPASGWSDQAAMSSDARYVLFISSATNLIPGDSKLARRAFIYDTQENQLRPITGAKGETSLAAISGDGRYIALAVTGGETPGIYLHDQVSDSTKLLDININTRNWRQLISQLEISADGSRIAILVNDKRSATLYFYLRQQDQATKIADIEPRSASNPDSDLLSLPADGRSLIYISGKAILQYDHETGITRDIARFPNSTPNPPQPEQVAISADGQALAFQLKAGASTDIYTLKVGENWQRTTFISGYLHNELGAPISGVEISDGAGHTARTDAEGNFRFEKVTPGAYTISPVREGVGFSPDNRPVSATLAGISGLGFVVIPDSIVGEGRKDIGMPYSLNRGCESPFQECGGPFHGFYSGDCTDLVIDAYTEGVKFDIQLALDRDFLSNPRHYYRWRDARNAHDMWRYYAYTGQVITADQPYLPGDIVFFDWELDGVVDHVALISEVNNRGRPRKILDATGITADNPSGLAAELDWRPYHASRTPGHARWTGMRSSQNRASDREIPILLVALDSSKVALQLSDTRGRSISSRDLGIPGGSYLSTGIGKVISIDQPLMTSEWYFLELSGANGTPYQLGIQIVDSGVVVKHQVIQGTLSSNQSILIPIQLKRNGDQFELKLP
jgi:Tol biopolymer transport system component